LIGLVVDVPLLSQNWQAILWGILAALLARLLVIYGLFPRSKSIPRTWKHVMYWGGLRGAISLALALGLPISLAGVNGTLQAMTFGLVIFTLLVQGTTMSGLIRWAGLVRSQPNREEYDLRRARAVAVKAGYQHISRAHNEGMISDHVWKIMSSALDPYLKRLTDSIQQLLKQHPDVEAEELDSAWREFLQHQRTVLNDLHRDHTISDDAFVELSSQVDEMLTSSEIVWSDVQDLNDSLWSVQPDKDSKSPGDEN
jgi:CPA1 family monovalent cation:H+ antiporter